MNRFAITLACATLAGLSSPAMADKGGSCHFHGAMPAKEETVITCAAQRKDTLAASGKIDPSWKAVRHEKLEQIEGRKGKEWKVTFRNPQAPEKDKQTLYVFLSLPGNVLAANFSGQ